jgi:nucleoside-diphosphate-sugar epimerase
VIVRPGLIYGPEPRGLVGAIARAISGSRFVPLIGGGGQTLYTCHEDDLVALFDRLLVVDSVPTGPIVAASDTGVSLRQIAHILAARKKKTIVGVPVPWQAVWLALRSAEALGVKLAFRSDSVLSLTALAKAPDFSPTRSLGAPFRAFDSVGAIQ